LTTNEQLGCRPDCKGAFADFDGQVDASNPPQYGGPGAENISRLIIDGAARSRSPVGPDTQGFSLFAVQPTEFSVDEYAEEVILPANRGLLTFNGQPYPLGRAAPLKIKFDRTNPARIEIAAGEMALMRLDGVADEVYLGEENLMPRRIDSWPWYVQLIFGAIIAFCGERLYSALSRRHAGPDRGTGFGGHDA